MPFILRRRFGEPHSFFHERTGQCEHLLAAEPAGAAAGREDSADLEQDDDYGNDHDCDDYDEDRNADR